MRYGAELVKELNNEIEILRESINNRYERIEKGLSNYSYDYDFMDYKCKEV